MKKQLIIGLFLTISLASVPTQADAMQDVSEWISSRASAAGQSLRESAQLTAVAVGRGIRRLFGDSAFNTVNDLGTRAIARCYALINYFRRSDDRQLPMPPSQSEVIISAREEPAAGVGVSEEPSGLPRSPYADFTDSVSGNSVPRPAPRARSGYEAFLDWDRSRRAGGSAGQTNTGAASARAYPAFSGQNHMGGTGNGK